MKNGYAKYGAYVAALRRLLIFMCCCCIITLAIHVGLEAGARKLNAKDNQPDLAAAIPPDSTQETALSPYEAAALSLERLENQRRAYFDALAENPDQREAVLEWQLELWTAQLRTMSNEISAAMDAAEAESLAQSQLNFMRERHQEGLDAISSVHDGEERLVYLSTVLNLTRERCYSLLQSYRSYLGG